MHITTAIEKLESLTLSQVKHLLQQCEQEIVQYKYCISNYPPDRMEKYGKPFIEGLEARRDKVKSRLECLLQLES